MGSGDYVPFVVPVHLLAWVILHYTPFFDIYILTHTSTTSLYPRQSLYSSNTE